MAGPIAVRSTQFGTGETIVVMDHTILQTGHVLPPSCTSQGLTATQRSFAHPALLQKNSLQMTPVLLCSGFVNNENGYHYHLEHDWRTILVARKMERSMAQPPEPRREPPALPVPYPLRKRISTVDLMQGAREIIILHQGEEYLLRITKTGKLILTK